MDKSIILIADDSPVDAFLLKRQLAAAKIRHEFRVVSDGQSVYDYLQGEGVFADGGDYPYPIILFLDLKMPTSGFDVLAFLKDHPLHQHLPVVALTGHADPNEVSQAYKMGARAFLTKPATADELLSMLRGLSGITLVAEGDGFRLEPEFLPAAEGELV